MSVTLLEVLAAAKARRSSLVGETIGYLVLAVAEEVVDAPRHVTADVVLVTQDGAVSIQSRTACSSAEAETDLRSLLGQLLVAARVTAGPLGRLSMRDHPGATRGLVSALEAALVPINRAAGRRALGRLHREIRRAIGQVHIAPASFELSSSPQPGLGVLIAQPEPLGLSDGASKPDSHCTNLEPDPSPDPVLEVSGWAELDDDVEEALLTEPPTARLNLATAPLPLVTTPDGIPAGASGDFTEPLPPARPNAPRAGGGEESHTAPLVFAPPARGASGPENGPLAEVEASWIEPVQPDGGGDAELNLELGELEPPRPKAEPLQPADEQDLPDAGQDAEPSVELGDYVAAAAGLQELRPDFQPVPVARRTFSLSGVRADTGGETGGESSAPDATEQAEWVELEDLEKSSPPPLAWLDGRHGEASPRPTGVVEALLADFDGDLERLQVALELLGRAGPEAGNPKDLPAEGSEWELDLGLFANPGRPVPPPAPPPDPAALWRAPRVFEPVESDVDELLGRFSVSASRSHSDLCRYLTEIAGLDRTPPPPPLTGQPIVTVGALPRARSDPPERGMRAVQAVWSWLATDPRERVSEIAPDDEDPLLGPGAV